MVEMGLVSVEIIDAGSSESKCWVSEKIRRSCNLLDESTILFEDISYHLIIIIVKKINEKTSIKSIILSQQNHIKKDDL